ncbi:MAG TPA: thymidylate synthase [Solirubrobacterales bacterium]|nr:thymidylate synthase [Solirubrobacterales bacterium]
MDEFEELTIGRSLKVQSVDEALGVAMEVTLEAGHTIVEGARPSSEILDLQIQLDNPRDRLLSNPKRKLGLVSSIARFAWMMGGNERLKDIQTYQPKVAAYSDDKLTVPGSNYGKRLIAPRPGLNQIEGVIGRLSGSDGQVSSGPGSRRAAGVIWQPDDAVRTSKDIPCAFGVMYAVREGKLIAKTVMRSNNGVTLLPVNLFEFGLLAEVIAAEAKVELGPLRHDVFSFHIYENERGGAEKALSGWREIERAERRPMPPMPVDGPLAQTRLLAKLEAELRHDQNRLRKEGPAELLARSKDLDPYWTGFYRVLLVHAVCQIDRFNAAEAVVKELPDYFQTEMSEHVDSLREKHGTSASGQLFDHSEVELAEGKTDHEADPIENLRALCEEIQKEFDMPISMSEYVALEQKLVTGVEARRSADFLLKKEDVARELENIRSAENN